MHQKQKFLRGWSSCWPNMSLIGPLLQYAAPDNGILLKNLGLTPLTVGTVFRISNIIIETKHVWELEVTTIILLFCVHANYAPPSLPSLSIPAMDLKVVSGHKDIIREGADTVSVGFGKKSRIHWISRLSSPYTECSTCRNILAPTVLSPWCVPSRTMPYLS